MHTTKTMYLNSSKRQCADHNAPATEPVPAAGDDGESMVGEVSIGDATSTPSSMPSTVSTPAKETLGRECEEIEEVVGVDKDSVVSIYPLQ